MGQGAVPGHAGTAGRDYGDEGMRWQAAGSRAPASPGQQAHPAAGPAHQPAAPHQLAGPHRLAGPADRPAPHPPAAPPQPAAVTPPGTVRPGGAVPEAALRAAQMPHAGMPRHWPSPVQGEGPAAVWSGPGSGPAAPEDLAGLAVIGNQLRVPVACCEAGRCGARYEDPSALGEADARRRAIAAGWRETVTGMLTCPACQQRAPWPGFRPGQPYPAR
jgi:hypothetical protein